MNQQAPSDRGQSVSMLRTTPVFAGMDEAMVEKAVSWFEFVDYGAERELLAEGVDPYGLFVLLRGEVEIRSASPNGQYILRELEAPSVFGEVGLLAGAKRSASVLTKSDVTVAYMPLHLFEEKAAANDPVALRIGLNLGQIVAERFRWTLQRMVETQDALVGDPPHDEKPGLFGQIDHLFKQILGRR